MNGPTSLPQSKGHGINVIPPFNTHNIATRINNIFPKGHIIHEIVASCALGYVFLHSIRDILVDLLHSHIPPSIRFIEGGFPLLKLAFIHPMIIENNVIEPLWGPLPR